VASKPGLPILKRRSEFLYILKNGQRVRPTDWLVMNFTPNVDGQMRCGWTLPRQVGPAVVRNRLRRWARVYFNGVLKNEDTAPVDLNLVFRKAEGDFYKRLKYAEFSQILDRGWKQVQRRLSTTSVGYRRHV
jgi:ribonuclease P protein component